MDSLVVREKDKVFAPQHVLELREGTQDSQSLQLENQSLAGPVAHANLVKDLFGGLAPEPPEYSASGIEPIPEKPPGVKEASALDVNRVTSCLEICLGLPLSSRSRIRLQASLVSLHMRGDTEVARLPKT